MTDHTCLACGKVHAGARDVTLHDGSVVSSYSEAWRNEAEALAILRMTDRGSRRRAIYAIEQKRGKHVADRVQALVRVLWDISVAKQRAAG